MDSCYLFFNKHVKSYFIFLALQLGFLGMISETYAQDKSLTQPDLLVPKKNQDLSAYRLDVDVFGWSRNFQEIAALGCEVHRDPFGGQKGDAFMLVYEIGKTLPKHNIIMHRISHTAIPHDPVPIEDVRDLLWLISKNYEDMWPIRPKRHKPSKAMDVVPRVDLVADQKTDLCQPYVGFSLYYQGHMRFQQPQALDMHIACSRLQYSDSRIYWADALHAAAMSRFDFRTSFSNEKSARFAVGISWQLAKQLQIQVISHKKLEPHTKQALQTLLAPYGMFQESLQEKNKPLRQTSEKQPKLALKETLRSLQTPILAGLDVVLATDKNLSNPINQLPLNHNQDIIIDLSDFF